MLNQLKLGLVIILLGVLIGSFGAIVKMSNKHNFERLELICKDICGKQETVEIMVGYNLGK